jgi:hypothetical protein
LSRPALRRKAWPPLVEAEPEPVHMSTSAPSGNAPALHADSESSMTSSPKETPMENTSCEDGAVEAINLLRLTGHLDRVLTERASHFLPRLMSVIEQQLLRRDGLLVILSRRPPNELYWQYRVDWLARVRRRDQLPEDQAKIFLRALGLTPNHADYGGLKTAMIKALPVVVWPT